MAVWSRKVLGRFWGAEDPRGCGGPGTQRAGMPTLGYAHPQLSRGTLCKGCPPQWKARPLFPTPNPDPVPTLETQASRALSHCPVQVPKVDKKVLLHHAP